MNRSLALRLLGLAAVFARAYRPACRGLSRSSAVLALVAALGTGCATAQDAAPLATSATASATGDDRRPPLFVVQDADSRVYLLGSIHVLPEGALPLPAAAEAAYADAEVVAFEVDLDAAQAEAPAMMEAAVGGTTTAQALSPDQKAAFDAYAAALGVPAGALDAFEPWMAGLTVTVLAVQRAGVTGEGVDAHYYARAGADGKERAALETMADQTAAFDGLPVAEQVRFLMASVEQGPDAVGPTFARMVETWRTGDDAALGRLMAEGMNTPALREALLAGRNRAWVPQLEALLARDGQDALVVVGAGHLVGPDNVVEMLRARGLTVTRL